MANEQEIKKGTLPIRVSKEVVGHLSLGLYRNFARAVKELISNAYDAGATEVKIKLDLPNGRIIVRDNGRGMDIKEVKEKFLTIGYPAPLTEDTDELGRKRIGTFGIGCLSVFPYCEKLQVITKKRGQSQIIELEIDTSWFFKEEGVFRLIEDAEVPYTIYPSDLPKEIGETIIVLQQIKPHIAREFSQEEPKGKVSIDKFSGFEKFKWTLAQYAPIQFSPSSKELRNLFSDSAVPMRLWIDATEVFRNVPEGARILEKGEDQFGDVSVRYVIMTTMGPIEPEEARGLQVRLRDVSIGLPTDFDVTKFTGKVPGKLNYICGEVHIMQGLNSALMIDRDSFSFTQDVANIHDFFRRKLIKWNDTLEKWALEDKEIYESLMNVDGSDAVISELRKANVIRFAPTRLRLSKAPIVERKGREVLPQHERLVKALSRVKDYKVVPDKKRVSAKEPLVKVIPKQKTILVHEEHPNLLESIKVRAQTFKVKYGEWDPAKTSYSICRLSDDQKVATFNSSHPIFTSRLSIEIIKRLSLGILLIVKDRKDKEELLKELNQLLERTLLG